MGGERHGSFPKGVAHDKGEIKTSNLFPMKRLQKAIGEGNRARKCMASHYLLSYQCRKFAEIGRLATKEPSERIMQAVCMLISRTRATLDQPAVGPCRDKAIPLPGADSVDKSSCSLGAITPNLCLAPSNC